MIPQDEKEARQDIRDLLDGGVLHPRPWQITPVPSGSGVCDICLDEGADAMYEGFAMRNLVHPEPCARLWGEEARLRAKRMGAGAP